MAQAAQDQADRRKVERTALRLTATMRDGTRSRVKVRVIDMSTNGCRIECSSIGRGRQLGLAQHRRAWRTSSAASSGIARNSSAWSSRGRCPKQCSRGCSPTRGRCPRTRSRSCAASPTRTHWLARQAEDRRHRHPRRFVAQMREDAVVEGLRLGESPKRYASHGLGRPLGGLRFPAEDPGDAAGSLDPLGERRRAAALRRTPRRAPPRAA